MERAVVDPMDREEGAKGQDEELAAENDDATRNQPTQTTGNVLGKVKAKQASHKTKQYNHKDSAKTSLENSRIHVRPGKGICTRGM